MISVSKGLKIKYKKKHTAPIGNFLLTISFGSIGAVILYAFLPAHVPETAIRHNVALT
jgi:hypothetical protein